MKLYNSRYNFCIPAKDGNLLYNSKTGGTIFIDAGNISSIIPLLTGKKLFFNSEDLEESTLGLFLKNGFLVEENRDELLEIQEKYWEARGESPVVYTITTTMDCNLGCYYCFENRSKQRLEAKDIETIVFHVKETFEKSNKKSLHVDWFGGEPLLNLKFLEETSLRLQEFCLSNNINYHASVVSNGTLWPVDVEGFIIKNKMK